jgi:hypothetical protein
MGEQDDAQDYPCGEKREITTHDGQEAVHDSPGGARAVSMMSVGARLLTVSDQRLRGVRPDDTVPSGFEEQKLSSGICRSS